MEKQKKVEKEKIIIEEREGEGGKYKKKSGCSIK